MLEQKRLLKRAFPFIILGLLAFVIYLLIFVNINEMLITIGQADLLLFVLAIVSSVVEMVFFSLAWQYFLAPLATGITFKKAFMYSLVSNFIDLLVPAESVSGEISRIYFVSRDGVNTGKVVASVVTQRILGMFIILFALIAGSAWLLILHFPLSSLIQNLIFFVVAATTILLSIILVLCFKENWTYKIIERIFAFAKRILGGRWSIDLWSSKAKENTKAFYESLRAFSTNIKKLILPVVFSLVSWFFSVLVYYIVFAAVGYTLDWAILSIVFSLIVTLKSIPIGVPTEMGLAEIAMTTLFGAFGVPLNISAAATVLIRIITVWFRLILGFIASQWVGVETVLKSDDIKAQIED